MMSNFQKINTLIDNYLSNNGINVEFLSTFHETSKNDSDRTKEPVFIYNFDKDLQVIDMDAVAKYGYKIIKNSNEKPINTADAFLINSNNDWFFIEFKDSTINAENSKVKNSIIKKAYANLYMLLDIIYDMKDTEQRLNYFNYDNPIQFVKEHIFYIVVCSTNKNPQIYKQIKNKELLNQKYTPPFMYRIKDYLFKDAYIYTEEHLEKELVRRFRY